MLDKFDGGVLPVSLDTYENGVDNDNSYDKNLEPVRLGQGLNKYPVVL